MSGLSLVKHLAVPTGFPMGKVNIYAIKTERGYYLIDVGIATDEAQKMVREWLPYPLAGILITHSHLDHLGIAWQLAKEQGCPVFLNAEEFRRLQDPDLERRVIDQLLVHGGVPTEDLLPISEGYELIRQVCEIPATDVKVEELLPGQRFNTELGVLEVVFTPGHSSGHCCFYLADNGILFSGDHILPDISPNPILDMGKGGKRRKAFKEYLDSLKIIEALSIGWVYPGHGKPFSNLAEVLEKFHAYHLSREQGILTMLSDVPQTPYQITRKIYPETNGIDIFLAISKVWGHLDILESDGKILALEKEGIISYKLF